MTLNLNPTPWWRSDHYVSDETVPEAFGHYAGPKGLALVKAWPDGRTDAGWGLESPKTGEGFMPRYQRDEFNARRVLFGYERDRWAFAFVMRSVQMICIDIDGKNGGLEHAKKLGALPLTMAETSKSGDGYHLFYIHPEKWDSTTGYGELSDRIGIQQGVDIRATGCVYHHKQQRWNGRAPAMLPGYLLDLLRHHDQQVAATSDRIQKVLANNDTMEVLMMHDQLLADLAKPIAQGKRNNTLFAIGQQMKEAGVPEWEDRLHDRAIQVGLDYDEADKIVANVAKYGNSTP